MVQIRDMQAADAAEVFELYAASWRSTYGSVYDEAGLDAQIDRRFSEARQREEALDTDIITMVAEDEGRIAGGEL